MNIGSVLKDYRRFDSLIYQLVYHVNDTTANRRIEHVETDVLRVSWWGTDHSRLQGAAVLTRSQTLGSGKFGVPSPSSFRQSIVTCQWRT